MKRKATILTVLMAIFVFSQIAFALPTFNSLSSFLDYTKNKQTVEVDLKKGWNMIGVPLQDIVYSDVGYCKVGGVEGGGTLYYYTGAPKNYFGISMGNFSYCDKGGIKTAEVKIILDGNPMTVDVGENVTVGDCYKKGAAGTCVNVTLAYARPDQKEAGFVQYEIKRNADGTVSYGIYGGYIQRYAGAGSMLMKITEGGIQKSVELKVISVEEVFKVLNEDQKRACAVQNARLSGQIRYDYGYWIYSDEPCKITFKGDAVSENLKTLTLQPGWNFVTVLKDMTIAQDKKVNLGNCAVGIYAYVWDPVKGQYDTPNELKAGKAYWIYSYETASKNC